MIASGMTTKGHHQFRECRQCLQCFVSLVPICSMQPTAPRNDHGRVDRNICAALSSIPAYSIPPRSPPRLPMDVSACRSTQVRIVSNTDRRLGQTRRETRKTRNATCSGKPSLSWCQCWRTHYQAIAMSLDTLLHLVTGHSF